MKILEHGQHGADDYFKARKAGISTAWRFGKDTERLVQGYDGPPAHIVWDVTFPGGTIAYAIPYQMLDLRRDIASRMFRLDHGRRILSFLPSDFIKIWMHAGKFGGDFKFVSWGNRQNVEDQFNEFKPTAILGTTAELSKMAKTSFNLNIENLETVYVNATCRKIISEENLNDIYKFFKVRVVVFFYLPWIGIVSHTTGENLTPMCVGSPIMANISFDSISRLYISSPLTYGVKATRDGLWNDFPQQSIPTEFYGFMDNGELFLHEHAVARKPHP